MSYDRQRVVIPFSCGDGVGIQALTSRGYYAIITEPTKAESGSSNTKDRKPRQKWLHGLVHRKPWSGWTNRFVDVSDRQNVIEEIFSMAEELYGRGIGDG